MSGHVIGNRFTYLLVFLALMVGTALTVGASYVHMGWLNTPVAPHACTHDCLPGM